MFSKNMGAVEPFVSDIGNHYFANIKGTSYNEDWSFLATLRALLFRRMPEGDSINLWISSSNYSKEIILENKNDPATLMACIFNSNPNTISVINYRGNDECIAELFKLLDDPDRGYIKVYGGTEQKDIEERIKNFVTTRFYVDPENRRSTILVQNLDIRKYHFIQSFIVRALPWYFAGAPDCLDELDRNLIKSFREKYAPEYENAIAALANLIDFRETAIKMVLTEFDKHSRDGEIANVRNSINDVKRRIENAEQTYKNLIKDLDNYTVRLNGLRYMANDGDAGSELIEYFKHNKAITPISTEGSYLTFLVKTFLELFDEDIYERYSKQGTLYDDRADEGGAITNDIFKPIENRKILTEAIFANDPKIRVKLCGIFHISTRGSVDSERHYTYPKDCDDYMPNPHLQIFACLGNNRPKIQQLLRDGDYITAIEQCISATKSVNLTEVSQTIRPFLKWVFNSDKKIIRLNDGRDVTSTEALQWLKEQNEKKEEDKK